MNEEDISKRLDGIEKLLNFLSEAYKFLHNHIVNRNYVRNEQEIFQRFDSMERKIDFFSESYKELHKTLMRREHINFENNQFDKSVLALKNKIDEFRVLYLKTKEEFKDEPVLGTLAFMAKRIHEINENVNKIKEDGIKKKIHLDLTMDGYEMVKAKPSNVVSEISQEELIHKLFSVLTERERNILTHRYGLFGTTSKTYKEIGEIMDRSMEIMRQGEKKAIRKLRRSENKRLVKKITHLDLRRAIMGNLEEK